MRTIIVKPDQTVYDILVEYYGTCEAISELLDNNPGIENDDRAKIRMGIDPLSDRDFYIDLPVKPGMAILVDTGSKLMRNSVTREIGTGVTTFNIE